LTGSLAGPGLTFGVHGAGGEETHFFRDWGKWLMCIL